MNVYRRLVASLILLVCASSPAFAQGTQLTPPGFRWGSGGMQTPAPGQMIGYDSSTGLPCIVGSTATCSLATSAAAPPTGGATAANQATIIADLGAPGADACATDTASCNFNQLFQRIAQRLTTINTTLGTPIQGVAQGSTTSGQTGLLIQGAVTTAAPTYVDGQTAPLSISTAGGLRVGGAVASGAIDSGDPIKVGGVYNSTLPTFTTGQRGNLQIGTRGSVNATLYIADSATPARALADNADAVAATSSASQLVVNSRNSVFNGTTWDRLRGDTTGVFAVGNVASGATDSGNPLKVGGVYNSTLPTFTTGQRADLQVDSRGNLRALAVLNNTVAADGFSNSLIGLVAPTTTFGSILPATGSYVFNGTTWDRLRGTTNGVHAVPAAGVTSGASFLNIAAGQATTTIKSGAGTLYAIVLNSAATATNTTTIYDNTAASGTVIGRPAVTTATVPTTLTYGTAGVAFATGLTIITAAANGGDMTVIYK